MIIKRKELKQYTGLVNLNESQRGIRFFSESEARVKVFLSHKHQDKDELFAVKKLLEECGAEPYVDWLDRTMPEETNSETASLIKEKIEKCEKFIFIATIDSLKAPWCNWEIGYGDAKKLEKQSIAIFPLKEDDGTWKKNEYLRMYPTIEYENGFSKYKGGATIPNGFYVEWPEDEDNCRPLKSLKDWLLSNTKTTRIL